MHRLKDEPLYEELGMSSCENKKSLVFGVGINDLTRAVVWRENGKRMLCPIYRLWQNMLGRCYDDKAHERLPTYTDCSTVPEWLYLSKFEKWVKTQDWEGKQLDKDILYLDNKIYSPETCVFVEGKLNTFLLERTSARGLYPVGVDWSKKRGKFRARCSNPFTVKKEHLGYYDNPEDAHLAWKKRKHEHALTYADQQTDPRIAEALRTRYL